MTDSSSGSDVDDVSSEPSDGGVAPSSPPAPGDYSRRERWRSFVARRTPGFDPDRRTVLKAGGAAAAVTGAGVLGLGWYPLGIGLPGHVRPDGAPPATPAVPGDDCDEESTTRLDQLAPLVSWGDHAGRFGLPTYALRVNETAFEYGDAVRITLTRVSPVPRRRAGLKHNLQVWSEDGWQEVRGMEGDRGRLPWITGPRDVPGTVRTWEFPLTERGVVELHAASSEVVPCRELPVGRYRFLCAPVDEHAGLAVAFDLVE